MANSLEKLFERVAALQFEQAEAGAVKADDATPEERLQDALKEAAHNGQLLHQALRWTTWLATIVGLLVGTSSVLALTSGDGTTPVNVLWVMALTMLLPLLTACGSFLLSFPLLWSKGHYDGGLLMAVLRSIVAKFVRSASDALDHAAPSQSREVHRTLGVMRSTYRMVDPVVSWLLLGVMQRFALALAIGFISGLLLRLLFVDITFGWTTTIEFVSQNLPAITDMIAWPFGWISSSWQPSTALVEATRFSRYAHQFVGGEAAVHIAGQWWPFLISGAIFWGIAPRVCVIVWIHIQQKKAVQRVLQQTEPLYRVQERLRQADRLFEPPEHETQENAVARLQREASAGRAAASAKKSAAPPQEEATHDTRAFVIYWEQDRMVPAPVEIALLQTLDWHKFGAAFLGNDGDQDACTREKLIDEKPDGVLVFVEPFANAGAGFVRQIRQIRTAVGEYTPILISVGWYDEDGQTVNYDERDNQLWQQVIDTLADPHIKIIKYTSRPPDLRPPA